MKTGKRIKNLLLSRNSSFWIAAAFFVVSLIPLLVIGKYNVMSADDYAMGKEAVNVWRDTHQAGAIFRYACLYTGKVFQTWQGCFTINFLDCWNPGFFGEQWAWLTPVIMLAAIAGFSYVCCGNVISGFFEDSKKETVIVWGIWTFLTIQTMPSPAEGLYWFSGAVAYTFLHFFMLFVFSFVFKMENIKSRPLKVLGVALLSAGMFLVGGSQYITALECLIIYFFYLLAQYRHLKLGNIIPAVFLVAGFAINILAPGNSVRNAQAGGMNPLRAILQSFAEAVRYGKAWCSLLLIVCLIFMVPFIWKIVSGQKREYRYRYPGIISLLSFCIFAAAFTPSLYGVGNVDAGRIQNLIQVMFYIAVTFNLFYWLGWLKRKTQKPDREAFRDIKTVIDIVRKYAVFYQWLALFLVVLVFAGTGDKNTFSGMSALRSLVNGEARTYYAEAQERLEIYRDDAVTIAEVAPFSVKPHVLFFNDVHSEDSADYWINENIAAYYEKEKVVLIEENNSNTQEEEKEEENVAN